MSSTPSPSSKPKKPSKLQKVANLKHPDLRRACILRGLSVDEYTKMGVAQLSAWLIDNYHLPTDPAKLLDFTDQAKAAIVKNLGEHDSKHLLVIVGMDSGTSKRAAKNKLNSSTRPKKEPGEGAIKKAPRARNETFGIYSGTKKELTYRLAKEGVSLKDVISEVKKAFPEAMDKSVGIWYKRAIKP